MNSMNIAVFGTSIMWGQGLEDADKIHSVLAQMLQVRHPDRPIKVTFLAHSGASTGFMLDGSVDSHREPRIDGEVPTLYPTILQQIDEFDEQGIPPESVDLVVLDAGINDVNIASILDPLNTPRQIERKVEVYCYQHMKRLLEHLLDKFKHAKIVVIGYYQLITEESQDGYARILLRAFGKVSGGLFMDALLQVTEGFLKRRLLGNSLAFATFSLAAFKRVAQELNSDVSSPRLFVTPSAIQPKNASFTRDPWLYGINPDLSPQDPLVERRSSACDSAEPLRTMPIVCAKASVGHPNAKGAQAYAKAIFKCLYE